MIRQCVPIPQKIYRLTNRLRTLEEVDQYFPGFTAFIDCTEQQIQRRKNKIRRRNLYFSGKKKRHTIKNQLIVNNQSIIVYKTGFKRGRRHDYDIYKKNHPVIPNQVVTVFDLGYLAVEKDFPDQKSSIPNRKKRNHDLSAEEKEYNKNHSRKRIVIEHIICKVKKYKILADIFRNRLRRYNKISDIVSGLINYSIMNQI